MVIVCKRFRMSNFLHRRNLTICTVHKYPSRLHLTFGERVRSSPDIEAKEVGRFFIGRCASGRWRSSEAVVVESIESHRKFVVQNNVDQDLANAVHSHSRRQCDNVRNAMSDETFVSQGNWRSMVGHEPCSIGATRNFKFPESFLAVKKCEVSK